MAALNVNDSVVLLNKLNEFEKRISILEKINEVFKDSRIVDAKAEVLDIDRHTSGPRSDNKIL